MRNQKFCRMKKMRYRSLGLGLFIDQTHVREGTLTSYRGAHLLSVAVSCICTLWGVVWPTMVVYSRNPTDILVWRITRLRPNWSIDISLSFSGGTQMKMSRGWVIVLSLSVHRLGLYAYIMCSLFQPSPDSELASKSGVCTQSRGISKGGGPGPPFLKIPIFFNRVWGGFSYVFFFIENFPKKWMKMV